MERKNEKLSKKSGNGINIMIYVSLVTKVYKINNDCPKYRINKYFSSKSYLFLINKHQHTC